MMHCTVGCPLENRKNLLCCLMDNAVLFISSGLPKHSVCNEMPQAGSSTELFAEK